MATLHFLAVDSAAWGAVGVAHVADYLVTVIPLCELEQEG